MKPQWTGERLETFVFNQTTFEHLHRYAFAQSFVRNKNVLDIACGEGYGTSLLAEFANTVVGIDIDETTVMGAQNKYVRDNLKFQIASITDLPLSDHYFDVVISFETIEHITDQDKMLLELKRVLKQDGILIISTPDKKYFTEIKPYKNPFHPKELYKQEFADLLHKHFRDAKFLQQNFIQGSILADADSCRFDFFTGDYQKVISKTPEASYWIAIASNEKLPETSSSFFYNEKIYDALINKEVDAVKQTVTYRLGQFLLSPLKRLRSIFKSK
jgi:2-polyprenyl-3-methyl-5-hydroxy-6-metoxy-1,4-benzoquinol methylase